MLKAGLWRRRLSMCLQNEDLRPELLLLVARAILLMLGNVA
jgi:hypothetical protein